MARHGVGHRASGAGLAVLAACLAARSTFGDVEITTFIHSSIQLEHAGKVIQIDPWSVSDLSKAKPADLILITDDVGHHLDLKAIARVRKPGAPVVIAGERPEAGARRHRDGQRRDARRRPACSVEAIGAVRHQARRAVSSRRAKPTATSSRSAASASTSSASPSACRKSGRVKNIDVAFFPLNLPLERMEPAAAIECLTRDRSRRSSIRITTIRNGCGRCRPAARGRRRRRAGCRN